MVHHIMFQSDYIIQASLLLLIMKFHVTKMNLTIELNNIPDERGRVGVGPVVDGDRVADAITVRPEPQADVLGAVLADPLRQHGEPRRPGLREGDEGVPARGDVGAADVHVVGAGDVPRVDAGVVGRLQAAAAVHAVAEGSRAR